MLHVHYLIIVGLFSKRMKRGYVLNIYDSLNYDIAFHEDIDEPSIICEDFMFSETYTIQDPCLVDTQHQLITSKPIDVDDENDEQQAKNVAEYNELFTNKKPVSVQKGKSYRCHMKDLRFRTNAKMHHDYNISKKILIQWTDFTNGFVNVEFHKVDVYNRLIVELYDPLTNESFKDYLLKNFPTILCYYQQPTTTIKLSEMNIGRAIPRPMSYQLKDYTG